MIIVFLSVASAVGVLALLLASRRPAEGWVEWFRGSLGAWREDELRWRDTDDALEGDLDDLLRLSEPVTGSAYTSAEELRQTFTAVSPRARRATARR